MLSTSWPLCSCDNSGQHEETKNTFSRLFLIALDVKDWYCEKSNLAVLSGCHQWQAKVYTTLILLNKQIGASNATVILFNKLGSAQLHKIW